MTVTQPTRRTVLGAVAGMSVLPAAPHDAVAQVRTAPQSVIAGLSVILWNSATAGCRKRPCRVAP